MIDPALDLRRSRSAKTGKEITMTTKEAAAWLGITPSAVIKLIEAGTLKAQRHGRDWWITEDDMARHQSTRRKAGRPRKEQINNEIMRTYL